MGKGRPNSYVSTLLRRYVNSNTIFYTRFTLFENPIKRQRALAVIIAKTDYVRQQRPVTIFKMFTITYDPYSLMTC